MDSESARLEKTIAETQRFVSKQVVLIVQIAEQELRTVKAKSILRGLEPDLDSLYAQLERIPDILMRQ
jgi:hypothetical protein